MIKVWLLVLLVVYGVAAYPQGPPEKVCQTGAPNHIPHEAMNPEEMPCPFLVDTQEFVPGETHILNITSWSGRDTFKGYLLSVFDENNYAVGTFGNTERIICEGAATTQSEGADKLYAEVQWTPPADSHGQKYYIWLTVVRAYSQFWVNCDPIMLPAKDAEASTVSIDLNTDANGDPINFTWPPTAPALPSTVSAPSSFTTPIVEEFRTKTSTSTTTPETTKTRLSTTTFQSSETTDTAEFTTALHHGTQKSSETTRSTQQSTLSISDETLTKPQSATTEKKSELQEDTTTTSSTSNTTTPTSPETTVKNAKSTTLRSILVNPRLKSSDSVTVSYCMPTLLAIMTALLLI